MQPFSISQIWNEKLTILKTEVKKRDYISASDLGGSFLDRYLKMTGVKPSNDYDERTLRIFDAGNSFEWLITNTLKLAGIVQKLQSEIEIPATKNTLKVRGFADCIIGGLPDWDKAREQIKKETLPEWLLDKAGKLVGVLEKEYPDGIEPTVVEIKTINSRAFWGMKNRNPDGVFTGYDHHKLQLLTYLLGQEIKDGRLFYISKDDLMLEELAVKPTEELVKKWQEDVEEMSCYYLNQIEPDPEPAVVFNKQRNHYETNWKLARSPYLTYITGKDKDVWQYETTQEVKRLNLELKMPKLRLEVE